MKIGKVLSFAIKSGTKGRSDGNGATQGNAVLDEGRIFWDVLLDVSV